MSRRSKQRQQQATELAKLERMNLRARFDLAQTNASNRNHWANADGLSARASISPIVRRTIRIRSRYESENNSWYAGVLRTAVNHIIGNGPRLQVLTSDAAANSRIELAFAAWCARIDFADKLRTMMEAYWRDGEVFAMRAERPSLWPFNLDVRTFETEQIASPWDGAILGDPFVDDGVRFDESTNELEFYVYDHHPGGNQPLTTMTGRWYPSSEVLHLFRAERPGQTRGLPRATPALPMLPIMRRHHMASLNVAESAANWGMYLKSTSPRISPKASPGDLEEFEMARNMMTILPAGWEPGVLEAKQPGPVFESFQAFTLKCFCRCTNMPYPLAAGTAQDSNFSSFKGDMRNVWRPEVVVEQNRVQFAIVERVFQWWLEQAVMVAGLLDGMPPIEAIPHKWNWPPLPDLDPGDTANANATRIKTGQATLTTIHAEAGQDYETEVARMANDFGVDVATMKRELFKSTFGIQSPPGSVAGSTNVPHREASPQPPIAAGAMLRAEAASTAGAIAFAASINLKAEAGQPRRFDILAYSGGPLNITGFALPVIVDLEGLVVPESIPILVDHKNTVETTVGHTDTIVVTESQILLAGPITTEPPEAGVAKTPAQQVVARRDHRWQASIGALVVPDAQEIIAAGQSVSVNGQTFTGPLIVSRRTLFGETSVLARGADSTTKVTLAASAADPQKEPAMKFEDWLKSLGVDATKLNEEQKAGYQKAFDAVQKAGETVPVAQPVEGQPTKDATSVASPTAAAGAMFNLQASLKAAETQFNKQMADSLRRHGEIQAKAVGYPQIAAKAIEENWSIDKVELEVLKASGTKTRPTSFRSAESAPENAPLVLEAAACSALKIAGTDKAYEDKILQAAHSQFKGRMGLQQLIIQAAAMNGMHVSPGERLTGDSRHRDILMFACPPPHMQPLQAAGFSAVSLSGILSNIANKELLQGYNEEDNSWRQVAGIKRVSDLKVATSYRMLDDMEYEELGPSGEIKHGRIGEESYTRQAKIVAKMLALTLEHQINDDLGALDDLRTRIGRGHAKKLTKTFWTAFMNNSTFFTSGNTNYITGSTTNLGDDGVGLGLAVDAFTKMTTPAIDGTKHTNADGEGAGGRPEILLVPPELRAVADRLYQSHNLNSVKVSDANVYAGKYKPVIAWQLSNSNYTGYSTTAFYLLNNPNFLPGVVVSFLNGEEVPTVQSADADFNTLGIQIRGWGAFGCDKAEYLCGIKSKGAA